jgi:hypothetical protein
VKNPAIRVEKGRGSADRLVDLCLRHPLPDHITKAEPGTFLVDLPPDVKVIVVVSEAPDPIRPSRRAHVVYVYRNEADRAAGLAYLKEYPHDN